MRVIHRLDARLVLPLKPRAAHFGPKIFEVLRVVLVDFEYAQPVLVLPVVGTVEPGRGVTLGANTSRRKLVPLFALTRASGSTVRKCHGLTYATVLCPRTARERTIQKTQAHRENNPMHNASKSRTAITLADCAGRLYYDALATALHAAELPHTTPPF